MQLEIEEAALQKETDEASKARLGILQKELADLKEEANRMRAKWQAEKAELQKYRKNGNCLKNTGAILKKRKTGMI